MKLDGAIIEHADTVVSVVPVWAPLAVAMVICGMPEHVIRGWSDAGEVRAKKLDGGKLFILTMLASGIPSAAAFLDKLTALRNTISNHQNAPKNKVILSTIHSSKGLEYDTIFLADIMDGVLPSKTKAELEGVSPQFRYSLVRTGNGILMALCPFFIATRGTVQLVDGKLDALLLSQLQDLLGRLCLFELCLLLFR